MPLSLRDLSNERAGGGPSRLEGLKQVIERWKAKATSGEDNEVAMIEPGDVRSAFTWILGREPENDRVVADMTRHRSVAALRDIIIGSEEFREYYQKRFLSIFRFVFVRIPKTGSTSLINSFAASGLRTHEVAAQVPDLAETFHHHDVVAGHFRYGDILPQLNGVRPVFVSTVRDPVKRALSLYCEAREQADHPCHAEVRDATLLQAINRDGLFYEWIYNAQCRHLSNHHLFAEARHVIENDLFLIAGMGSIARLVEAVSRLAGVRLSRVSKDNASPHRAMQQLEAQPDFAEALKVIGWLTAEDRKLVGFLDDFYVSPGLRTLCDGKPWMIT